MLSHLVRRAVQAGVEQMSKADILEKQANAFAELDYEMPAWGIALLAFTVICFAITGASIEYTIRLLLVNLAIVESPASATIRVVKAANYSDDPDAPLEKREFGSDVEIEQATVFSKPITSSIRGAVKHLHSIGGIKARWTGFGVFALYSVTVAAVNFVTMMLPIPLSPVIGSFAGALVGARLHCAWTHTTISMPSKKKLKHRMIPRTMWRQLAGPTVAKVAAVELSGLLTIGMGVWSFNQVSDLMDAKSKACGPYMMWLAAPFIVAAATFFMFVVPAYVVLIRKEASLLAADEDTIVPFDRTFGGSVDETTGVLSAKAAWKSFTREAFLRVVKIYIKFFFMSLAWAAFFAHSIVLQVWLIMGDNFDVLIDSGIARLHTLGY